MAHPKPPLPPNWIVCRSKSYPDQVYYFNELTGVSSWVDPLSLVVAGAPNQQGTPVHGYANMPSASTEHVRSPTVPPGMVSNAEDLYVEGRFSPQPASEHSPDLDKRKEKDVGHVSSQPSTGFQSPSSLHPAKNSHRRVNFQQRVLQSRGNYQPGDVFVPQQGFFPGHNYQDRGSFEPSDSFQRRGNIQPGDSFQRRGNIQPGDSFQRRGNIQLGASYQPRGNAPPRSIAQSRGALQPRGTAPPSSSSQPRGNNQITGNVNQDGIRFPPRSHSQPRPSLQSGARLQLPVSIQSGTSSQRQHHNHSDARVQQSNGFQSGTSLQGGGTCHSLPRSSGHVGIGQVGESFRPGVSSTAYATLQPGVSSQVSARLHQGVSSQPHANLQHWVNSQAGAAHRPGDNSQPGVPCGATSPVVTCDTTTVNCKRKSEDLGSSSKRFKSPDNQPTISKTQPCAVPASNCELKKLPSLPVKKFNELQKALQVATTVNTCIINKQLKLKQQVNTSGNSEKPILSNKPSPPVNVSANSNNTEDGFLKKRRGWRKPSTSDKVADNVPRLTLPCTTTPLSKSPCADTTLPDVSLPPVSSRNLTPDKSRTDKSSLRGHLFDAIKFQTIQSWVNSIEEEPSCDGLNDHALVSEDDSHEVCAKTEDSGYSSVLPSTSSSGKQHVAPDTVNRFPVTPGTLRAEDDTRVVVDMEVDDVDFHACIREVREQVEKTPAEAFGKLTETVSQASIENASRAASPDNKTSETQRLFIILDTCALLKHVRFIEDLIDMNITGFNKPILVVPWIVLQELDALKDRKQENSTRTISARIKAKGPVQFIWRMLDSKHPRLICQNPKDAHESTWFLVECNDDRILQCCIQYKEKYPTAHVVLFSEDKNFCNKAISSDIPSFIKERLLHGLADLIDTKPVPASNVAGNRVKQPSQKQQSQHDDGVMAAAPVSTIKQDPHKELIERKKTELKLADDVVCELKMSIRDMLAPVLEHEMKEVYQELWLEIVFRKPPWTVKDLMDCFSKHWIAVFGMVFRRDNQSKLTHISDYFNKGGGRGYSGTNVGQVSCLLTDVLVLYEDLLRFRRYRDTIKIHIRVLKELQDICKAVLDGSKPAQENTRLPNILKETTAVRKTTGINLTDTTQQDSSTALKHIGIGNPSTSFVQPTSPTSPQSHETSDTTFDRSAMQNCLADESATGYVPDTEAPHSELSSGTSPEINVEESDLKVVADRFQHIWEAIHKFCESLQQVVAGGSVYSGDLRQSIAILKLLVPSVKILKSHFGIFREMDSQGVQRSIDPNTIEVWLELSYRALHTNRKKVLQNTEAFLQLANDLNNFITISGLQHQALDATSTVILPIHMQAFFGNKHNRKMLDNGFIQLCSMIKMLQDSISHLP